MKKLRSLLLVAMPFALAVSAQAEPSLPGTPGAKSKASPTIAIPSTTAAVNDVGGKRTPSGVIAAQNAPGPQAAVSAGKPGVIDAKQKVLVDRINTYLSTLQT